MPESRRWIAEPFDIDVLRELYRTGVVTMAGVDPRLNVTRIATKLGASRARVAARLAHWQREGFVRGYDVWPNPALFGLVGSTIDVELSNPLAKAEFFERLDLVEGVVGALEFLGPWVSVQIVGVDPDQLRRRIQLLRHLDGVAQLGTEIAWHRIEPKRPLSPLDVRIVQALRAAPRSSLAQIARSVGISTRTVTHRYGALVDDWSVWFVPVFDFTRLSGVVVSLIVQLDPAGSRTSVARELRNAYPNSLEFGWTGSGGASANPYHVFFVHLAAAAMIEEVQRTVTGFPGVAALEATVMVRVHTYGRWVDELLARSSGRPAPTSVRPAAAPTPRRPARRSSRPVEALRA